MTFAIKVLSVLFIPNVLMICCRALSLQDQVEHILRTRSESLGSPLQPSPSRRSLTYGVKQGGIVLGVPTQLSHLPRAEPILPGHTLLRPSFGMLKSAVKFPHRDLEDGAGVYGHYSNIGIKYDGKNERLLHSNFRRMLSDYIMVVPKKSQNKSSSDPNADSSSNPHDHLNNQKTSSRRRRAGDEMNQFNTTRSGPTVDVENILNYNYILNDDADSNDSFRDSKLKWFWNSKNMYDHVKISDSAPKLAELVPADSSEDSRNWWYYNQDDKPSLTNTQ